MSRKPEVLLKRLEMAINSFMSKYSPKHSPAPKKVKLGIRFIWMLVALAILPAVTSCNTVEGFGKDVQKAGTTIEKVGRESHSTPEKDGPIYDFQE